mmetsp:Transcript_90480/g.180046  ORF Transcript_90480/g.180046 Transcript_90480/m.180046 type:complete len:223 (-) Transcript_90480:237-905(-)
MRLFQFCLVQPLLTQGQALLLNLLCGLCLLALLLHYNCKHFCISGLSGSCLLFFSLQPLFQFFYLLPLTLLFDSLNLVRVSFKFFLASLLLFLAPYSLLSLSFLQLLLALLLGSLHVSLNGLPLLFAKLLESFRRCAHKPATLKRAPVGRALDWSWNRRGGSSASQRCRCVVGSEVLGATAHQRCARVSWWPLPRRPWSLVFVLPGCFVENLECQTWNSVCR